ncbi:MAG: hypothetical protein ABSC94_28675 [Polyangiaceae bacterium]|jgi:hypothetical protein
MFDDVLLAQSAVDRFKNAAYDFVIEGESYRPRLKPTLNPSDPPPDGPATKPKTHPRTAVLKDEDLLLAKVKMEQFFAWAFQTFPAVAQIREASHA